MGSTYTCIRIPLVEDNLEVMPKKQARILKMPCSCNYSSRCQTQETMRMHIGERIEHCGTDSRFKFYISSNTCPCSQSRCTMGCNENLEIECPSKLCPFTSLKHFIDGSSQLLLFIIIYPLAIKEHELIPNFLTLFFIANRVLQKKISTYPVILSFSSTQNAIWILLKYIQKCYLYVKI